MDLPRINEKYSRRRYRFVYGISRKEKKAGDGLVFSELVKIDLVEKKTSTWFEKDCLASEPIFIAAPDSQEEDDGVVLSSVYDKGNGKSYLLVLDGRKFTAIGQAEVPLRFTPTFHGYFSSKEKWNNQQTS